jgi:hypothetical protein
MTGLHVTIFIQTSIPLAIFIPLDSFGSGEQLLLVGSGEHGNELWASIKGKLNF